MRIYSITYDKVTQDGNDLVHDLITEPHEADDFKMLLQDRLVTLYTAGAATHFFADVHNIVSVAKPVVGEVY